MPGELREGGGTHTSWKPTEDRQGRHAPAVSRLPQGQVDVGHIVLGIRAGVGGEVVEE